jgi:hypothetical protein
MRVSLSRLARRVRRGDPPDNRGRARSTSLRARRLVVATVALLMPIVGLATFPTTPAEAGAAQSNGRLIAAIYNDTPWTMEYVNGWSEYGFRQVPKTAPEGGASLFEINGSAVVTPWGACYWYNTYNGWFTYKLAVPNGSVEYLTFSIHGMRRQGDGGAGICSQDLQPALDVYYTSTPPPSSWRWTQGAPPNVIARPKFEHEHNVPYLFDQTISPAEGPGEGAPAIVSLGDSTISGEGGRWAGNTNQDTTSGYQRVDAGDRSYWDTPTGESILDCHRSKSAEVHIGSPFVTQNFACSAAETKSYDWYYSFGRGWRWKPGVDLHCEGSPCDPRRLGQLRELSWYAQHHNVKAVVLAVGANDFGFSDVVQTCIEKYEEAHLGGGSDFCYNSGVIQAAITPAKMVDIAQRIANSLKNVASTMKDAGYTKDMYTVILQNYWSAIPSDEDIRIADDGFHREDLGGCPILDPDATALNEHLLPAINDTVLMAAGAFRDDASHPRIRLLDVSGALNGHRLCENGVTVVEDMDGGLGTAKGTEPSSADKVEWVTQARVDDINLPYTLAEGGHANYWGQLALRNCLRMAINGGVPRSGKCQPDEKGGVNGYGEPNMELMSYLW